MIASVIQLNAQSRKQAALKKVQQAELKKRLRKTVSLGNDTPEMVSAEMSTTYQLYLNAKDGDAIEFRQKKFIKGKHRKVGDFLLKKIMTTHAKDKRRREQMKSRGQGMNLVDALQERITLQVVGDGMMLALLPAKNLVNVVGDGIVEGSALGLPAEIPQGNNSIQQGKIYLENLLISLIAEEQDVADWTTKKGIGMPKEILASQDEESVRRKSMQTLLPKQWLINEVINFFLKHCLERRDKKLCKKEPRRRRLHFFNSFFVQTMFNLKNNDLNLRGGYNYENVRHWSKKVPGKDIFKLKYIFCRINLNNWHWTLVVIFMEEKKI